MLFHNLRIQKSLLDAPPKKVILSGPSGFLGSRVLESILKAHHLRKENKLPPGEVILLSSSPGRLMERLYKKHGADAMKTVRASRVDYYSQHSDETWMDHLGSLGPIPGKPDAMMDVNYKAPAAAARACERLGFGHWVQSSTQATNAERGGQVPYSRGKAMMDYALARCKHLPVTIACLGLLYSKIDGTIGQSRGGDSRLNLIDLSLLPLTPIMGDGSAPLQPQEVYDASNRLAYLALSDPSLRPKQCFNEASQNQRVLMIQRASSDGFRYYDAVGPETMSMLDMLGKFAVVQGNNNFRPVYIRYRNMEKLLNVKSLGNLNRQFVSLLRSEQDAADPIVGDYHAWEKILDADEAKLLTLDEAFQENETGLKCQQYRTFPYGSVVQHVVKNPKVIWPGILLSIEITRSFLTNYHPNANGSRKSVSSI
eukprot:scaffold2636_cov176-Ochromonas_danica.AAC.21